MIVESQHELPDEQVRDLSGRSAPRSLRRCTTERPIDLAPEIRDAIAEQARLIGAESVVLFGSRARGTARPRSDIDLAVRGADAFEFKDALDENVGTLLIFDVVELDRCGSEEELRREVERDGAVIYEKA